MNKTSTRQIPWWEPLIGDSAQRLVHDVVASNFVNDGEVTTAFENKIAGLLGCKYAVGVTSGTCALFCSLKALDIGVGDEVIVPDATFIATVHAVTMTGATPVLVDIDPRSLTMAPQSFERAITNRTRAVIPVHVSGRAADMRSIMRIADDRGVAVVEDAAEAFMSKANNRYLGTIGKLGCFSFSPLKVITTGQGGLVVTDDAGLHGRLREIKDQGRRVRSTGVDTTISAVGYNFKLTNMQTALGLGQLENLEWRLQQMRRLYRGYAKGLAGIKQVTLPGFNVDEGELPLWTDALAERRDDLNAFLKVRGIDCRTFWKPIHTQPAYRASDSNFPHAVDSLAKAIWLPAAFSLTDADVATVCSAIAEFYDGVRR